MKRKKGKRVRFQKIIMGLLIFFCVVLFAALLHLFWLVYSGKDDRTEQNPMPSTSPASPTPAIISPTPEAVPAEGSEPTPEAMPTVDPAPTQRPMDGPPEYPFRTEDITIEIPGLKREYTLAWVSDLHMVSDLEPATDVQEEYMETIQVRYEFFKTEDGVYSKDLWPEIVRFLNYGNFDGVIFGGDMIDYCSKSNLEIFLEGYRCLNAGQIMYIRADHDYGYWYGGDVLKEADTHDLHVEIDGNVFEEKLMDFEEFIIVGINDSTQNMSYEQYDSLVDVLGRGKPVIIVTHVPYESKVDESLEQLSMDFRNKIYYWGGGDYVPYGATEQYFEIVYSDYTSICQVLAGHLHKPWDGNLTERVKQHIFTPAFEGTIGMIHIIPEEQE
ncbi:MAG: hypothetical protein HDQ98_09205 [Lachnospiraceae bacterium]|nr:hypothetical protein [Lachnospiraceae bacterium]